MSTTPPPSPSFPPTTGTAFAPPAPGTRDPRPLPVQLDELEALQATPEHAIDPALSLALARLYPRAGRDEEAVRAGAEALAGFQARHDAAGACDAQATLALAYSNLGVGREALESALQSLRGARALGDTQREAWALLRVGNAYQALDNPIQARDTMQQAREIAQAQGWRELDVHCLNHQASATLDEVTRARQEGEPDVIVLAMAQLLSDEALRAALELGQPDVLALATANRNEARLLAEEWDALDAGIDAFETIAQTHRFDSLEPVATLHRAMLAAARGQLHKGIALIDGLLVQRAGELPPRLQQRALHLLYQSHKSLGDHETALHHLERWVLNERRAVREAHLMQVQLLMMRQEVEQTSQRADHAQAAAEAARRRAGQLEVERARLREELVHIDRAAREDPLTGLGNRRHGEAVLDVLAERTRTHGERVAIALIDLDHFKRINDRLGHAMGDAVLKEIARLLQQQLRPADALIRWGGEEFLVALSGTGHDQADAVLDRLRQSVVAHDWQDLHPDMPPVTLSIGLCRKPHPGNWRTQLHEADQALYAAKANGRNRLEEFGVEPAPAAPQ